MSVVHRTKSAAGLALICAALFSAPHTGAQIPGLKDLSDQTRIAQLPDIDDLERRAKRRARREAERAAGKALFPLEGAGPDLHPMNRYLDDVEPELWGDMADLPRTETGGFELRPGAWRTSLRSYCLRAGTYAHPGGAGYRSGPFTGKMAPYIRNILARSYGVPEVEQRAIQMLLWGILAGAPIRDMNDRARYAADELLTPEEIRELNGSGGYVQRRLTSRARRALPPEARRTYEALRRMRRAASRPSATYSDMERIAVLSGEAPPTDDDIPATRWSWHPDGYFIRQFSTSYRRTDVEIVVPDGAEIIRDAQSRITEWRFDNGDHIRTSYMDGPPMQSDAYPDADIWRFARVEIRGWDEVAGRFQTAVFENRGFTFVRKRNRRRGAGDEGKHFAVLKTPPPPVIRAQAGLSLREIRERAEAARERNNYYRERWERLNSPATSEDVDSLMDREHYRDGLDSLRGSQGDRLEWIIDNRERQNRSLWHAINVLDSLPTTSTTDDTPRTYEPAFGGAHPSSGGTQRRGTSGAGI